MAGFVKAFDKTMGNEGIYSNDPDDEGGETFYGISRVNFPGEEIWLLLDSLKLRPKFPDIINSDPELFQKIHNMVMVFYKRQFWDRIRGDEIIGQYVAEELFDFGVNSDIKTAVQKLQQCLNALNQKKPSIYYPDMLDDGLFGSETLNNLNKYIQLEGEEEIFTAVRGKRISYLIDISIQKTLRSDRRRKFVKGWMRRLNVLYKSSEEPPVLA